VEFAKKTGKSYKHQGKLRKFLFFRTNPALLVELYGIIFWRTEKGALK